MKYIAIAFLFTACYVQAPASQPQQLEPVMVEATINGTSEGDFLTPPLTWITDIHGHRGHMRGIWGTEGTKVIVICDNGYVH